MNYLVLAAGILILFLGVHMLVRPHLVARRFEQLDAIGSQRRLGTVEPAGWLVTLTRFSGGFVLLMGGFVLVIGSS